MTELRERIYQRTGFSNVELDAVMAVVGPLVAAEAKFDERLSDLQAEYLKREQAWDRTRELLTRERDQARQVARQANNNCADFAEVLGLPREPYGDAMITAIDRLRWLRAEAVWQRDQFRANEVESAELANDIFMAAGSKLASAVVLPEDAEELLTDLLEDQKRRAVILDAGNIEFDAQYVAHIALDLVRSWRPATVEAAPQEDLLVDIMSGQVLRDIMHEQGAGTGTEASDV